MSEIDRARTQRQALDNVAGRKAVGTERSYDSLRRYLGAEIYAERRRQAPVSAPHQAVTSETTEPAGQSAAIRVRPIGGHGYEIAVRGARDGPVLHGAQHAPHTTAGRHRTGLSQRSQPRRGRRDPATASRLRYTM